MHGKMIDRAAGTALAAATLYLLLLNAGAGIPLSCAGAFIAMALLRRVAKALPRRARVTRAQATAALLSIARMPEPEAEAALWHLTGRETVVCALRHPGAELSADELLALWRAHMGEDAIAVAATCPAAASAFALAGELEDPRVELIDGLRLARAIRATGQYVPPTTAPESLAARCVRALRRLASRPPRAGVAFYGLSLLGMYMATGRPIYLAVGLGLLGTFGAGWIRRLI